MVHTGQSAFELVIGSGGRLELQAVQITDVYGGAAEETWGYRLQRPWAKFDRDGHSSTGRRPKFSTAPRPQNPMARHGFAADDEHDRNPA